MKNRSRRWKSILALCAGATLLQVGLFPSGCAGFVSNGLITAFNFCGVLNCSGGSYFNLCDPSQTIILIDCPAAVQENP